MERFGQLLRPLPADPPFAVLHFADVVLGNAGQCGKLLLGKPLAGAIGAQGRLLLLAQILRKDLGNRVVTVLLALNV